MVTGVVLGIRGIVKADAVLQALNLYFPRAGLPREIFIEKDEYICFISGLEIGHPHMTHQLLYVFVDFLLGGLESEENGVASKIVRLVLLGDSIYKPVDARTVDRKAVGDNENYLAVGSNSGVVNVYDMESNEFASNDPKPLKSVMNLTTSVEGMEFNPNGEVLAMYSKWKRDAFKLLHVPSMTVFANWPSFRDHLKFPMACAFNHTSELLCIGNDEGIALLYKLNHYSS